MTGARDRDRGVALINALVVVLAMAAAAGTLMARSVETRRAMADTQATAQAGLYLDAGALLVQSLLEADWDTDDRLDHLGEAWARDGAVLPIDRGTLSGQIEDLQGRFNVNWLLDDDPAPARRALDRLVAQLGLDAALASNLARTVADTTVTEPEIPLDASGDLRSVAQLRAAPGLNGPGFEALRPFLVALPRDTALNVNTATSAILTAVFPNAQPARIAALLDRRAGLPFQSVPDFQTRFAALLGARAAENRLSVPLAVGSTRFLARLEATVGAARQGRLVACTRDPATGIVTIEQHRVTP